MKIDWSRVVVTRCRRYAAQKNVGNSFSLNGVTTTWFVCHLERTLLLLIHADFSLFHNLHTRHLFTCDFQGQYIITSRKMPRAVKPQRMFPLFKRLILNQRLNQFAL